MRLTKGKECVADVLARIEGEITTDQVVDLLEEADYWSEEYDRRAERRMKKYDTRVLLRKVLEDSEGRAVEFMHVSHVRDPKTGRRREVYKQLRFFVDDDYVQAASYYHRRGAYHFGQVKRLVHLATKEYGPEIQARFPFVETGADGEVKIVA